MVDSGEAAAPAGNQGSTLFRSTGGQPGPAGDGSWREMVAWDVPPYQMPRRGGPLPGTARWDDAPRGAGAA